MSFTFHVQLDLGWSAESRAPNLNFAIVPMIKYYFIVMILLLPYTQYAQIQESGT